MPSSVYPDKHSCSCLPLQLRPLKLVQRTLIDRERLPMYMRCVSMPWRGSAMGNGASVGVLRKEVRSRWLRISMSRAPVDTAATRSSGVVTTVTFACVEASPGPPRPLLSDMPRACRWADDIKTCLCACSDTGWCSFFFYGQKVGRSMYMHVWMHVWVHADSFLRCVASPFHSFVTTCMCVTIAMAGWLHGVCVGAC